MKPETQQEEKKEENKQEPAKFYVVHQALKDTNTASVFGTYLDRKAAEHSISQARGGVEATGRFQGARYFIEEKSGLEEIAAPEPQPLGEIPAGMSHPPTQEGEVPKNTGLPVAAPEKAEVVQPQGSSDSAQGSKQPEGTSDNTHGTKQEVKPKPRHH